MKHHVIYIPGISDDVLRVQSGLIQVWRLFGVRPHLHALPWAGEQSFQPKLARLLAVIDALADSGKTVSLVGASAGASAVLHAYAARQSQIVSLAYICAKINSPEAVSDRTYRENPAFKEALYSLQPVIATFSGSDKSRMLSFYSKADITVSHADTVIEGVPERVLPALRHGWAILYAISFGAHGLLKFLKHPAQQL